MNKATPRKTLEDLHKVLGPEFVKQGQVLRELEEQIMSNIKEMIGGAQPKVLLTQNEDGNLELDKTFEAIFEKQEEPKYKLVRDRDGLTRTSKEIKWLEFNEEGRYKADYPDIAVGRSLIMSPFNQFFAWQTTLVTEIVEHREDYIKFKTENSLYELFVL